MCVYVLVWACAGKCRCLWRPEEDGSPGTGVTDYWELNLSLLHEQCMLSHLFTPLNCTQKKNHSISFQIC